MGGGGDQANVMVTQPKSFNPPSAINNDWLLMTDGVLLFHRLNVPYPWNTVIKHGIVDTVFMLTL